LDLEGEKSNLEQALEKHKNITTSESILVFVDVLFSATFCIAYYIWSGKDKENLTTLRNSLGVIQDVIKDLAHHRIINILKYFVEPLDIYESKKEKLDSRTDFEEVLSDLKNDAISIRQFENSHNELLSQIQNKPAADFREKVLEFKKWARTEQHDNNDLDVSQKRDEQRVELGKSLDNIDDKQFVGVWEYGYAQEYILKLAVWLGKISMKRSLKNQARWL
jgi:hypothetical protein